MPGKTMWRRWLTLTAAALCGCYAEGESFYLGQGQAVRYPSMSACRDSATSRHPDGTPRYSGYECRSVRFGRIVQAEEFWDGLRAGGSAANE